MKLFTPPPKLDTLQCVFCKTKACRRMEWLYLAILDKSIVFVTMSTSVKF